MGSLVLGRPGSAVQRELFVEASRLADTRADNLVVDYPFAVPSGVEVVAQSATVSAVARVYGALRVWGTLDVAAQLDVEGLVEVG